MKLLKKLAILAFAILLTINCHAQQKKESLLWKVSGNGLSKPSYIAATFHTLCAEHFIIKDKVKEAIESADQFILEINYLDPKEVETLQRMVAAEKPLGEQLSAAEATRLDSILRKSYNSNFEAVKKYSPQALYALISQKSIDCSPEEVRYYDAELLKLAASKNKKFGGLESAQAQLDYIGKAYNLQQIIDQLAQGDEYARIAKKMIQAFNNEETDNLYQLSTDKRFMSTEQKKWVLDQRNKDWATVSMPQIMQQGTALFAMGGAHLSGENGVIELLRKQGYTLSPVNEISDL